MGVARILAGAVVGIIVYGVMAVLLWWIPLIGWLLPIVIGGCAAGLVARGAGAGAAAGCLATILVVGVVAVIGGAIVEKLFGGFQEWIGIEFGARLFVVLLILSIPTACCMTVSGAIGGSLNKPPEKPVTVEVKPQEQVTVPERGKGLYCPYCGHKNLPDAIHCSECGKKISS